MWNGHYTRTEFEKQKADGCKPSDLSDLLGCPTDEEICKAARQFSDEQGNVPTAFAFQAGARWGFFEGRRTLREKIRKVMAEMKKIQFELNETKKDSPNYGHLFTIMYGLQGELEDLIR